MALQVTMGTGSLVALGISVGDVATLINLTARAGSWLTASSGDTNLMKLLDTDEFDIITRRGLLDTSWFNRRWGSQISLLINLRPTTIDGQKAEATLEKLTHFTATMVCIIATLDAFTLFSNVKDMLKLLLLKLFRTTEYGEDVFISQCNARVNSWRSSATARGLSTEARRIRQELIASRCIMEGLLPHSDTQHVVTFLYWLLTDNGLEYSTPSSDVAGVAYCLSKLGGIDWLGIQGFGAMSTSTAKPCQLRYDPDSVMFSLGGAPHRCKDYFSRQTFTTVNLKAPEEAITTFPLEPQIMDKCRAAWLGGHNIAQLFSISTHIRWEPSALEYIIQKRPGKDCQTPRNFGRHRPRIRPQISQICTRLAFLDDDEICQELQAFLKDQPDEILQWVVRQFTVDLNEEFPDIEHPDFVDDDEINAFTLVQSFFLGYYYGLFLALVDTSTLRHQVVEGAWGFRSLSIFDTVNGGLFTPKIENGNTVQAISRADLLPVLSLFVLGERVTLPTSDAAYRSTGYADSNLVGIIRRKALFMGSCLDISKVTGFILLDVDISGVPTDNRGLVRIGTPDTVMPQLEEETLIGSSIQSIDDDATFHIEPDWNHNPDEIVLCARYRGRRILTFDPCTADPFFIFTTRRQTCTHDSSGADAVHVPTNNLADSIRTYQVSKVLTNFHTDGITELLKGPPVRTLYISHQHRRLRYLIILILGKYAFAVDLPSTQANLEQIAAGWLQNNQSQEGRHKFLQDTRRAGWKEVLVLIHSFRPEVRIVQ